MGPAGKVSGTACPHCCLDVVTHAFCSSTGQPHQRVTAGSHKTRLCRHFERGHCRLGDKCGFAHGSVDLRQRASGSRSPSDAGSAEQSPQQRQQQQQPMPWAGFCSPVPSGGCLPSAAAALAAMSRFSALPQQAAVGAPRELAAGSPCSDARGAQRQGSLCRHFAQGRCTYGTDCGFAHRVALGAGAQPQQPAEQPAAPSAAPEGKVKTRLCRHHERGYCRFGDGCGFAHGQTELRRSAAPSAADAAPVGSELIAVQKGPGGKIGATLNGTVVTQVDENSPLAAAGVRAGARIISINGRRVGSLEEVKQALGDAGAVFTALVLPGALRPSSPSSDESDGSGDNGTMGHSEAGMYTPPRSVADAEHEDWGETLLLPCE
eukprot:TRINITY_DN14361_c0_g1_i4.p1 TRINITY_DN14361_c0_g1~~TRINITY_DN14361_c0_g1_i4.p1  ORF type:complete len:377 (+),score=87.98 TRINITY_DN14361_c0_g1_i4:93-1223(+)